MPVNRIVGAFRGLAVGDALGAPVEFQKAGEFEPVENYRPTVHFSLKAGQWTDDTAQAVCLADALIASRGYDSYAVMDEYLGWFTHGKNTPNNYCFDIGIQTRDVLEKYPFKPTVDNNVKRGDAAGNGCIMRLAPVAIAGLGGTMSEAQRLFRVSARETHYSEEAEEATIIFGTMLIYAFSARIKADVLQVKVPSDAFGLLKACQQGTKPAIYGGGYVRDSLLTALECFMTTESFEQCVLKAVNYGNDADTTAAIAGQLAGAFYGDDNIPQTWKDNLWQSERIKTLAQNLLSVEPKIIRTRFEEDLEFINPK